MKDVMEKKILNLLCISFFVALVILIHSKTSFLFHRVCETKLIKSTLNVFCTLKDSAIETETIVAAEN